MAETLTRPKRTRRSKASDPRDRELKRLKLSVCDDIGFRLYLATYDQPKRRDELILRVAKEAEAEKVQVTRLDLAEGGPETNLVGLLRAHLASTMLPSGWRQAVMVTGIEQRLDYASAPEGFAFLHQANLLRDALPGAVPVPVVLWLSRMASAALPAEAPDLWHWRAANFDFTGDEAPRLELLRELATLKPRSDFGLSGDHRRARIEMLKDLLAELEREGPPRSKRQAAEQAHLLLELGIEHGLLGHAAEAIPPLERALNSFCETNDRLRQGDALGNLGAAYAELGETRAAIEYCEQALAIAREVGDRRNEGYALGNLGYAYSELGEVRRAIEYYEQVLAITREMGDRRGQHIALGNLGAAHAGLGETREAIEFYEQALAIAREIRDRQGEGSVLGNLGAAYAELGETRAAIEYCEQALAIARKVGDRKGQGYSLFNGAELFDQLGEREEAIRRMKQALRVFEQIKSASLQKARQKLTEWLDEGGDG